MYIANEMIYNADERLETPILLSSGRHLGYRWTIISFHTHPCIYIRIPKKNNLYEKDYDDISESTPIQSDGTLSYSRNYLWIPDEKNPKERIKDTSGWWLGWDFMRGISFCASAKYENPEAKKKWTTSSLIDECYKIICQIAAIDSWNGIFDRWTDEGEYSKEKTAGHIKFSERKN